MPRGTRTIRTQARREKFLTALAEVGVITTACQAAGIGRQSAYDWRRDDAEFAAAWENAYQTAMDRLEREAFRRACEGWEEPVFYQGEVVGTVCKYSDRMLEMLLRAGRPEKYRNRTELSGQVSGGVQIYLPDNGRQAQPDDAIPAEQVPVVLPHNSR